MSNSPAGARPAARKSLPRRMVESLDAAFYPGYSPEWENVVAREMILSLLQREHVVLDVGAGWGIREWTRFKGHAARVCGIDPSPRVMENPHLDEAKIGVADDLPYPDGTFDVAYAWNVAEHLADPERVFREVARVLKPGGVFVIKTPNLWHYVSGISRVLPHALHERIIAKTLRRPTRDVFPTYYRCNTGRRVRRLAASAGFKVREIRYIEPRPEYLRFSPLAYPFGIVYERIVNASPLFAPWRVVFVAVMEKQS